MWNRPSREASLAADGDLRPRQLEIVLAAPIGIEQDVERLGDVLKFELGLLAHLTLEAVRMTLAGQLAEADRGSAPSSRYAQPRG